MSVRTLGCHVTEAFEVQLHRNHTLYPNLSSTATAMLLPSLRAIGSKHDNVLNYYRARWQALKLPPLFAEVYDFPKLEEQGNDDCGTFVDEDGEYSSAPSGSNKVPYEGTAAHSSYYDESDGNARENAPFCRVRISEVKPEGSRSGDVYGARGDAEGVATNARIDDSRKASA